MSWACASRASWACPTAASRPPRRRRCRWVPRGRRTRRSTRAARGPSWTGRRARSTTPSATPGGQTYNPPSMDQETLADHLRRATRNFTARLPEERVFALGHALAVELARAHAEQPPRHPDLDPDAIAMADGAPRLAGGSAGGEVPEDLFRLGCLLSSLALGTAPEVSWRLDGPPAAELSTVRRRAVLAALAAPRRAERYGTAEEAAGELQAAAAAAVPMAPWPLFRGDPARTGARPGVVAARLRPVWRAAVGPVIASPVLTADLVLVPTSAGRLVFVDR